MHWSGLAILILVCAGCVGTREPANSAGGGQPDDWQALPRTSATPARYSRELRVLFLEQRFRQDARSLNNSLKRDRGLRYQGFFLDAQLGWSQPTSQYSEAIRREVRPLSHPLEKDGAAVAESADFKALGYDVIVLGDVDAGDSRIPAEIWEWLEEWVREGGGLVLLSGKNHNPRAYEAQAFAKLLPMTLDAAAQQPDTRVMKFWSLTEQGAAHTICKLSDEDGGNARLWSGEKDGKFERGELNGLYWHVAGAKPRDGTTVLARVAGPTAAEGDPLLSVREHGKGRVVWIGSDDTWLWREQVGDKHFTRFWQNVLAWAADALPDK